MRKLVEALRRGPAVAPLINGQSMAQEPNLAQMVARTMSFKYLKNLINKLVRILKRHLPY
jgi:hypothetical protein